jgi:glycosyltransferase involved in cell wall biosynthesis
MTARRIAFVLPSFAGGGAERVMLALAGALDRAAFAPEIVVLDGAGPWRSLVPASVPVTDLGARRIRHAIRPLARTLRARDPALAVSTIGALNLALLAMRPLLPRRMRIVVREANTPHRHAQSALGRTLYRWAYPRLYRRAARVIVPAAYLARELAADFGVPAERIALLHNPVDEAGLRAAALPVARGPGAGPRYVAVGRLTAQKGFDRLIAFMAEADPGAHLTILGDGPARAALEGACRAHGVAARVSMPGFAADAPRYIAGADALLLPSRWEGLPNVALEALALGTRVIATPEAGGIGEIAGLAASGNVVIATAGAEFHAAAAAVRASPVSEPRASMLPAAFRPETIAAAFAGLIGDVLRDRG